MSTSAKLMSLTGLALLMFAAGWLTSLPRVSPRVSRAGVPRSGPHRGSHPAPAPAEWRAEIRAVRVKFAERRTLCTDDAEAEARLVAEVIARLSDANTAAFVRSLTAEEAASPAGLAALERWLRLDPIAAARWVAGRGDGTEPEALAIARALAQTGRVGEYCDTLAATEWKQLFLKTAGLAAVERDPAAALAFASRMDEGEERINVCETAAYDWMTRDPVAATKWIEAGAGAELRERLLSVAARAIAVTEPELAAGWLATAVKSEGAWRDTALCLVETWAARDPAKAAAWAARFPTQVGRDAALDAIAREWARRDSAAAQAWIDTLPDAAAVRARQAEPQVAVGDP